VAVTDCNSKLVFVREYISSYPSKKWFGVANLATAMISGLQKCDPETPKVCF